MDRFKQLALGNLLLLAVLIIISAYEAVHTKMDSSAKNTGVLLELFTSQGCSSCPPADALLKKYAEGTNAAIIPLSFHVDYWDRLGWKDPFSDHAYTQRQRQYAEHLKLESIYTPEIIVNGSEEMVGSEASKIQKSIDADLKNPTSCEIQVISSGIHSGKLELKYDVKGSTGKEEIHLALAQKTASTMIGKGENAGEKLAESNVVRAFASSGIPTSGEGSISCQIPQALKTEDILIVLFVQEKETMKVKGAIKFQP